jgi:[ribosomal protein S18]-alanine N-acetyltransferase
LKLNTPVGFYVRAASLEDIAKIVSLERGISEAPHWPAAEYAVIVDSVGETSNTIRRCLLVAEADGRLLGFAVGKVILTRAKGLAELESVAVDVQARRRGVGRALCESVVAWCREQGAEALELEVRAGGNSAIALYRRLGFVVTGRRPDYYHDPVEDALLMELSLEKYK